MHAVQIRKNKRLIKRKCRLRMQETKTERFLVINQISASLCMLMIHDDIPPEMASDNTMDARVRKTRINMYNLFSSLTGQHSLVIKQIISDTNAYL